MQLLAALFSGLIFGLGLILSGMTNPAKVLAFLDLGGRWDPSLAFVMGGAVMVGAIAFRVAGKRSKAVLGDPMRLPTANAVDRRLVAGSLAFGVGWGLAGFCPGPALTSLLTGSQPALIFLAAMLAGMGIFEVIERAGKRA